MFTVAERDGLRAALISAARADERITGVALTGSGSSGSGSGGSGSGGSGSGGSGSGGSGSGGSGSGGSGSGGSGLIGCEDRWSDIDLAFGFAAGTDLGEAIDEWTAVMYARHGAVHHLDIISGGATYRVFLLASTLQVDLAFAPEAEFGATAPTFRLLSGQAVPRVQTAPPDAAELIGLAWLYGLHARSSIARGRLWQAEYMVSGVRDRVLALACLRHGLPAVQGRGIDRLPPEVTGPLAGALVRTLEGTELARAFLVATEALLTEIGQVDAALADHLASTLRELARPVLPSRNGPD